MDKQDRIEEIKRELRRLYDQEESIREQSFDLEVELTKLLGDNDES